MDHAYLDFQWLFTLDQLGAFFVTRAKKNTKLRRIYSHPVDRSTGIICDQTVVLALQRAYKAYPTKLRRIRFKDPKTGKKLVFLTNDTGLTALVIAALYKNRWQVELFFKWIKQHLRVKKFLATSENGVKIQIWSAIASYVLIAIIKKERFIETPLYTILQILSVSIFERTELLCALQTRAYKSVLTPSDNQLNLF